MKLGMKAAALAAAVTMVSAGTMGWAAPSIGVNFVDNTNSGVQNGAGDSLAPADLAGAPGYEQTNWNNFGRWGQTVGMTDSNGGATGATMTWDSNNTWNDAADNSTANGRLMHGYLDALGKPNDSTTSPYPFFGTSNTGANDNRPEAWVTGLSGWLAAHGASSYKVVVYADGDGTDRPAEYWLQAASSGDPPTILGSDLTSHVFLNDTSNFTGAFTQVPLSANTLAGAVAGNFIVFDGLTADSFMLRTEEQNVRAAINGMQIIAVPEPGSIALLGLGALGLLARRRRA